MPTKRTKKDTNLVVRRAEHREIGVFVDGVSLDRACKRLKRKVNFAALLAGTSLGITPKVARYYTIIPFEDDARQISYLDAVEKAGFEVVAKRLPPKGLEKTISIDPEITSDIMEFGLMGVDSKEVASQTRRAVVLVCPSKELTYPISALKRYNVETTTADFSRFTSGSTLNASARWIDLSDSATIWREL